MRWQCLITAALLLGAIPQRVGAELSAAEIAAFRSDLALLVRELPARHARIDHTTPRATFETQVRDLDQRLTTLPSRAAAIVALSGLVGLLRDGHSALFLLPFPGQQPIPGLQPLPVQFYGFEDDGWRVIAAARDHAELLGARLLAVGGVPVQTLHDRIASLVPRDNAMGEREYVGHYLGLGAVLTAVGVAAQADGRFAFEFETATGRRSVPLAALPGTPARGWIDRLTDLPLPRAQWVAAGDGQPQPAWLRALGQPYDFQLLPDGRTLHARIDQLREEAPGGFAGFVERLLQALPQAADSRLLIDLRHNRGGNGELRWALVHALLRDRRFDAPGRLFVLIGRRTFSAAQLLANDLDRHTSALFVGEPTGSSPNHYGELGQLKLPATGLTVLYSQLYWQHHPRDDRPWIAPDIAAPLRWADLAAGRDPALAAIDHWQPPADPRAVMDARIDTDPRAAVAAFRAVAQSNPWARPHERALNDYGYALLGEQRPDAALAVFELATALYPEAPNAWDSLGEAHFGRGNRARAAYCYGRTLRLNPDDAHARDMLARALGEP